MKLELKYLAGYLPYRLKVSKIHVMHSHTGIGSIDHVLHSVNKGKSQYKPILRPLSDLIKEIEVNGEKFVPMDKIAIYGDIDYLIEQIKTGMVEVIVWKMLLEWHFDIYGLIENGLAIDKNKL